MSTHREQLLKLLLTPSSRDLVAANLAYFLSMAFRGMYGPSSNPDSDLRRMGYGNEILHVLAKQTLMYKGVADVGYQEAALVQVIGELADSGDLIEQLEWACERTLAHF